MLMKPEWTECHKSKVELQEMPECEKVFGCFLEYLYTGKLVITHTNVMPILALADKYIVKVRKHLTLAFAVKNLPLWFLKIEKILVLWQFLPYYVLFFKHINFTVNKNNCLSIICTQRKSQNKIFIMKSQVQIT